TEFDIRVLLDAVYELNDRKDLKTIAKQNKIQQVALHTFLKKIEGTFVEELLTQHKLL
ncbi:hypothetical protein, partial [Staphylococcus pettenkoferi]